MQYCYKLITAAILFWMSLFPSITNAQNSVTYILPDGQILPSEKLDSLTTAWGGTDHIAFVHSPEDDKNKVMRLQKLTDEELRQNAEKRAGEEKRFQEMVGKPAPLWEVKDLNGKVWSLEKLKGKTVVMNFWFTSCPPCLQEMPHLNELTRRFAGEDVIFIAFTFNEAAAVRSFLAKKMFSYIQVPEATEVIEAYNIRNWPSSLVIDPSGIVRLAMNYDRNIGEKLSEAIESVR